MVKLEHEITVNGKDLSEDKELKTVTSVEKIFPPRSDLLQTRTIDGRSYTIVEKKIDGEVTEKNIDTAMSEEEVKVFLNTWNDLWHPTLSQTDLDLPDLNKQDPEPEVK